MTTEATSHALVFIQDTSEIVLYSQQGARHVEKNQPCQDACMAAQQFYKGYPYTLLAIADGHGSAKYIRSEVGAHLAMQAVQAAATRFIPYIVDLIEKQTVEWRSMAEREFSNYFGKWLHEEWKKLVVWHQDEKLGESPDKPGDTFERYGTTLAAVLLFEDQIFAGAIGDSVIYYAQQRDIEAVSCVFPEDLSVVGSQTDSLCSPYAHYIWDTRILDFDGVGMIVLGTDGFSDSLENPETAVTDIYRKVKSQGIGWLKEILPQEVWRWSDKGSRDDISLIICCMKRVPDSTRAP